jgi:hypothetical protein
VFVLTFVSLLVGGASVTAGIGLSLVGPPANGHGDPLEEPVHTVEHVVEEVSSQAEEFVQEAEAEVEEAQQTAQQNAQQAQQTAEEAVEEAEEAVEELQDYILEEVGAVGVQEHLDWTWEVLSDTVEQLDVEIWLDPHQAVGWITACVQAVLRDAEGNVLAQQNGGPWLTLGKTNVISFSFAGDEIPLDVALKGTWTMELHVQGGIGEYETIVHVLY